MTDPEHHDPHHHRQRLLRFTRIRRLKRLLRFMPRRARFHTYPFVGRFADFARKRSYLWSFRYPNVRPALYLGSILTLIPIPGQVPVAFFLCLGFRANFMLMGGLQFASNPATSLPLAIGTYKLGAAVLAITGVSHARDETVVADDSLDLTVRLPLPDEESPDAPSTLDTPAPVETVPKKKSWADHIYEQFGDQLPPRGEAMTIGDWLRLLAHLFGALLIGGLLAGLALGAVLDLLWRKLVVPAALHRAARKPITATVTPHDNPPSPDP